MAKDSVTLSVPDLLNVKPCSRETNDSEYEGLTVASHLLGLHESMGFEDTVLLWPGAVQQV